MRRDERMPAGNPLALGVITAGAVVVVTAMWVGNAAHLAWIDAQARMQALAVRLKDALDRMEIGILDDDD